MEAGFIALAVAMTIIGIVVGIVIGKTLAERRYVEDTNYVQGTLTVDCSNPEFEPSLFLGLSVPINEISLRKRVTLDIKLYSNNSRK